MASKVVFNFDNIQKTLSFYEQSQMKFAAQVSLTNFGKDLQKRIVPKMYKLKFNNPVSFTLNSTFKKQNGLQMEVGVKDKTALRRNKKTGRTGKGNPAANYLFPVIGRGSNLVYETLFSQHLVRSNFMEDGQYPFAVIGNRFIKRKASNGRVSSTTYQNTMIGLGKTRDKELKRKDRGNSKIQDARVIAFKKDTGKYKAGIYRQMTTGRGKKTSVFLAPLFMYDDLPTVPKRFFFDDLVIDSFRKTYPEIFRKELNRLTKRG